MFVNVCVCLSVRVSGLAVMFKLVTEMCLLPCGVVAMPNHCVHIATRLTAVHINVFYHTSLSRQQIVKSHGEDRTFTFIIFI